MPEANLPAQPETTIPKPGVSTTPAATETQGNTAATTTTTASKPAASSSSSSGQIAIGFGLDGYTIKADNPAAPTSINVSISTGVELDGHFMRDTSLKQDYTDLAHYLSFPIEYSGENGLNEFAVFKSPTGKMESMYNVGTLAHGGAYCPLLGASPPGSANSASSGIGQRIAAVSTKLNDYGAQNQNFTVGAAVSTNTILEYFQHFYPNNNVTANDINKLCAKGLLNAEVLFNFGGGRGKAFRIKIVDICKEDNKFYVMSVFFMTQALKAYCPLAGSYLEKGYSDARNDGFRFPFESTKYDYKTGTIPGFNVNYIKGIADRIRYDFSGTGSFVKFGGDVTEVKCRVRYFIDPEKKGEAAAICTTLPEEIYSTNYSEGESAAFETTSINIISGDVNNETILQVMMQLGQKIANWTLPEQDGKGGIIQRPTSYAQTGGNFTAGNSKFGTNYWWSGLDRITQWGKHRRGPSIDCSSFVTWVLLEAGVITCGGQFSSASFINSGGRCPALGRFNPGYTLQLITNPADVRMGDIQWNSGHIGFAAQDGSLRRQFGMGGETGIDAFKAGAMGSASTGAHATYAWRVMKNAASSTTIQMG